VDVFGRMAWYALLAITLGKIIATCITLNFGGSGGVFTPSLYIGASAGGTLGVALAKLFPALGLHPETYALVGMGAMIAGATDAPITGILLVFEMTNDYAIVLPLMLTVVISHAVARRLEPDSLYSGWLRRRGESMDNGADNDVLAGLRVADACDRVPFVITEDTQLTTVLEDLVRAGQAVVPVVDDAGALVGLITTADLGRAARAARDVDSLLLAADLAAPTETVALDDSLMDAVRRMGVRGAVALPVVDRASGRLLGLVSRAHVLAVYEQAVRRG
jgi:CIC family chloride channel protein